MERQWSATLITLFLMWLLGNCALELLPPQTAKTDTPPAVTTDVLATMQEALERIYQDVSPSVVNIQVIQEQDVRENPSQALPGWSFFEESVPQQPSQEQRQRGPGSGFVWDKEGHIVTNNHVVEGADRIRVTFSDGTIVSGTVVGSDLDSDLAVLKVDAPAEALHPVRLADSTQVEVGQLAVAIGNPFGLENTMTVGFVSALGRSPPAETGGKGPSYTIPDVIQTDAPINPGNSGGVLVNNHGEVIGVTSAIVSPMRASAGIGFAIPSAIVQKVVPALIETGHYAYPWLGISGASLNPDLAQAMNLKADRRGALVIDIVPGGPADKAGLRSSDRTITVDGIERRVGGDVIVAWDDQSVTQMEELKALLRKTCVGQKVTFTVLHDGEQIQVVLEAHAPL